MPIDELFALGIYYSKSLGCCVATTAVIGVLLFFAKRKRSSQSTLKLLSCLLILPTLVWVTYLSVTFREAYALTWLDTEDDWFAEGIYKSSFDVDLDEAIKIAVDTEQSGNVRFYASCRIADLLLTNDDRTKAGVLETVADAPEFRTDFFNTNQLTCGFFTPNYPEGPFTVSGIVTKRLQIIGTARTHP